MVFYQQDSAVMLQKHLMKYYHAHIQVTMLIIEALHDPVHSVIWSVYIN
jgi:hypothetical protein